MMKKKRTRVGRAKERAADNIRDGVLIPFVKRKLKEHIEDDTDDGQPPENEDDYKLYQEQQKYQKKM